MFAQLAKIWSISGISTVENRKLMTDSNYYPTGAMPLPMTLPLTRQAVQTARQFAGEQPNPQKAHQVYLNTLAVWAVNDYLQLMAIPTQLQHSDSWNPIVRLCADVADLFLTGLGRLECRPVSQTTVARWDSDPSNTRSHLTVPPEVQTDRLGYLAIAIDESRLMATLLGFTPSLVAGAIALDRLQSLDAFLAHLDALVQSQVVREPVPLNRWLQGAFSPEWQDIESLLVSTQSASIPSTPQWWQTLATSLDTWLQPPPARLGWQFRGTANTLPIDRPQPEQQAQRRLFPEPQAARAKLLDLGMQLGDRKVALLVAITQDLDRKVSIFVKLHPTYRDRYLPANLRLALLSETGETLQDVVSRHLDLCIQLLPFKVFPDTQFSLQVALDEMSWIEAFAV
jgi:Protein of unknown function (DUF1822)